MIRIATTAAGRRYIVKRLWLPKDDSPAKVYCWGDVVSFKGYRTRHDEGRTFLKEMVEISEVEKTTILLRSLLRQYLDALREKGYEVEFAITRKGNIQYSYRLPGAHRTTVYEEAS